MQKRLERAKMLLKHAEGRIFLAASVFLLLFALSEILVHVTPDRYPKSAMFRLILSLLICALYYLGGLLYAERTKDTHVLQRLMMLFFGIYLYLILNFTLLDKGMGRNNLLQNADENDRDFYLRWFVNMKPFHSIYEVYIKGFLHGYVNVYYTLLNLLGNVCAFMPFALFLPLFFPAQKRWYLFLPTVALTVASIEVIQFAFMVGSCDIDDLILNVGGAMILYFILRIPALKRLSDRFAGRIPKEA
ncbi:MAG: VanZ family protein [Clostridia bacterium]|nr:VanZ family protein [Clostridia bacterium]